MFVFGNMKQALVIQTCGEMDCYFNETISCTEKCGCDKIMDYQLRKSVKDVAKKFKEHHSANKKRLKDEKKYELEPCTAARQATSTNTCGEVGDCLTVDTDCKAQCGCDKTIPTFYDNGTQKCVINIKLLILSLNEKYNTEDYDTSLEDDMASKLQAEADKIFQGIIIAAFLDYLLKKSIKELTKKVGAKPRLDKPAVKPTTKPISESCNVVVQDAVGATV
ncbi:hypothetical protein MSG28_009272 [Choristoneura fumiferana]|uniref:Uncharacterized protein n=1 Tax=Choristoneura fumiferana TaxID=7141 RepID=A0ACC0KXF2_CHOFU|nr:hypothetical protein MSG28_009272 [Choristoneura fumiferana]